MTQDELKNEINKQIQAMSDDQKLCILDFIKYLMSIPKGRGGWWFKEAPDDHPSYSEILLFCISIGLALCTVKWPTYLLAKIHLFGLETCISFFLIPTFFWIFLRASRKDMNATSHLIAAGMGALGGALVAILTRIK